MGLERYPLALALPCYTSLELLIPQALCPRCAGMGTSSDGTAAVLGEVLML